MSGLRLFGKSPYQWKGQKLCEQLEEQTYRKASEWSQVDKYKRPLEKPMVDKNDKGSDGKKKKSTNG